MKARLLRVDDEPGAFAPLVAAMAERGLRCGWLDLNAPVAPPAALEAAAGLGMLRAVSAVGARTVAVKPVAGALVLRDLLREHFQGCAVVLARGEVAAATLRAGGEGGWLVVTRDGERQTLTTAELVDRLRRPGWPGGA